MTVTTIYVARIMKDWDMRRTHALRKLPITRKLKRGEVVLALNRRRTIARYADFKRVAHTDYAPKGVKYDFAALEELQTEGIGIRLIHRRKLKEVA